MTNKKVTADQIVADWDQWANDAQLILGHARSSLLLAMKGVHETMNSADEGGRPVYARLRQVCVNMMAYPATTILPSQMDVPDGFTCELVTPFGTVVLDTMSMLRMMLEGSGAAEHLVDAEMARIEYLVTNGKAYEYGEENT